jgi:tartrate-resistant acid phosphatase type 5
MISQRIEPGLVKLGALISILAILSLVSCDITTTEPEPSATPIPSLIPSGTPSPTLIPPTPSPYTSPPQRRTHTATHPPPTATLTATPQIVHFAVIGDYGGGGAPEADVSTLVKSFNPEFILTTGDNNYPAGSGETIDRNIGQFYQGFIHPYQGVYGEGAAENRFFPTLGNHDWNTLGAQPYLDYFTLPGNERYFDFVWGPVHFFALDSDSREPDGVGRSSFQAEWLQTKLAGSTSPWQIVYFHHAPFSSGLHGPVNWMQWPFAEWGADAVLSGHDHTYERIVQDDILYFVNGLGGSSIYRFLGAVAGSQLRYNEDYGAMLVEAGERSLRFQFINRQQEIIDDFELTKP